MTGYSPHMVNKGITPNQVKKEDWFLLALYLQLSNLLRNFMHGLEMTVLDHFHLEEGLRLKLRHHLSWLVASVLLVILQETFRSNLAHHYWNGNGSA